MKVLFAVSNEEISESIVKKYQKEYKQIISYKNVYYFNAILKELQKDKTYDRIVISEDLESFTNTQYDQIDKFIFDKLDSISDEASNVKGDDTPIILISSDRRAKAEPMLVKLFGIGIYDAVIGNDRSVDEVCKLINRPRTKKEAKSYYKIDSEDVGYQAENENDVSEMEIQNIVAHYKRLGKNEERYIESFNNIAAQYNDTQLRIITKFLPLNVRAVLEEKSSKYQKIMSFNNTVSDSLRKAKKEEDGPSQILLKSKNKDTILSKPVVIPSAVNMNGSKKLARQKSVESVPQAYVQQTPNHGNNQSYTNLQQPMRQPNPKPQQPVIQSYSNPEPLIEGLKDFDEIEEIPQKVVPPVTQQTVEPEKQEVVQPVKRGRGRPRKNPIATPDEAVTATQPAKRGRGRPRKNPAPVPEVQQPPEEDMFLPGLGVQEQEEEDTDENFLPGFYDVDTPVSQPTPLKQTEQETFLPGFDEEDEDDEDDDIFGQGDMILPGLGGQEIEEQQPEPRVIRNPSTTVRNIWNQCLSFK